MKTEAACIFSEQSTTIETIINSPDNYYQKRELLPEQELFEHINAM